VSLIDSAIGIRISAGIGVGDCQATEGLAFNLTWSFAAFQPEFIPQLVVFIRITVGPAIDGDRGYVASRIEATGLQSAGELLANVALHGFSDGCLHRFGGFYRRHPKSSATARCAWSMTASV